MTIYPSPSGLLTPSDLLTDRLRSAYVTWALSAPVGDDDYSSRQVRRLALIFLAATCDGRGRSRHTITEIEGALQLGRRTAYAAIRALKDAGLIRRLPNISRVGQGARGANPLREYELLKERKLVGRN